MPFHSVVIRIKYFITLHSAFKCKIFFELNTDNLIQSKNYLLLITGYLFFNPHRVRNQQFIFSAVVDDLPDNAAADE